MSSAPPPHVATFKRSDVVGPCFHCKGPTFCVLRNLSTGRGPVFVHMACGGQHAEDQGMAERLGQPRLRSRPSVVTNAEGRVAPTQWRAWRAPYNENRHSRGDRAWILRKANARMRALRAANVRWST